MSSPLAGALMITFFAPASMCALALSASVKMPVHSRTMSTPRSPHGRAAGSFSARTLISRPSMMIEASPAWTSPGIGAVRRVVLEQQRVHLGVDEVVDRDDLDVRGALDERLERLAADPAEAVDADAGGHGARPPGRDVARRAGAGRVTGRVGRGRTLGSDAGASWTRAWSTRIVRRANRTKGRAGSGCRSDGAVMRPEAASGRGPGHRTRAPAVGGGPCLRRDRGRRQPPIRKTLPPHFGHVPCSAGLPFFMVIFCGFWTSTFFLSLTQ